MRESIQTVASLWYTAWVNAGQPNLADIASIPFTEQELKEWNELNSSMTGGHDEERSGSN